MKRMLSVAALLLILFLPRVAPCNSAFEVNSSTVEPLQEEQKETLFFLQQLLSGEIPPSVFTTEQWIQIMDIGLMLIQRYPDIDITRFMHRYIEPALKDSPSQLRFKAYSFLAHYAVLTGEWDQRIETYLEQRPRSTMDILTQSEILAILMTRFSSLPQWQLLAKNFMNQIAPDGRARISLAELPATANLYFRLYAFNPNLQDELFGSIEFPTSAENLPRIFVEMLKEIAEAGLAVQGKKITPDGLIDIGSLEQQTIISEAMQRVMQLALEQLHAQF